MPMQEPPVEHDVPDKRRSLQQPSRQCRSDAWRHDPRQRIRHGTGTKACLQALRIRLETSAAVVAFCCDDRFGGEQSGFDRRYHTAAQLGPTGFTDDGNFIARPLPPIAGEFPIQHATFYAPGAPATFWIGTRIKF